MSYLLSLKVVTILILAAAGGSVGGVAYYYQARASSLNSQVGISTATPQGTNREFNDAVLLF
jgi:hypothetical protein